MKRKIMIPAMTLVLMFAGIALVSATAKASPVSKNGRLSAKGAHIVNSSGKTYQIKGVSTHGIAWFPQYVNKACFKSFKKMGANTIRLACYSDPGAGYSKSLWKTLDTGIKAATDLGMYVIVDWHILNDGNPNTHKKAAKKFFTRFAKKYKGHKNIIYEICNEPNGVDWNTVKKYANAIIKVIRKYDSKNIIAVGTPTWSQDVDTAADSPVNKKNVVYSLHFYAATHGDNIRNKLKYAYKKKLPVLVTEFSICDASGNGAIDKKSAKKWMKLLKKYKVGRIAWNISNKAETSALIKSSCQKSGAISKGNLSKSGKWIIKNW